MRVSDLDRVATTPIENYNPADVIRATNALQPLGKETALEQIVSCLEHLKRGPYPAGLLWILRVLFDMPDGIRFPPVLIGTANPPEPTDAKKLPRFPILIVRDIPLLLVSGYLLRGLPEPIETHINFFRSHGIIRNQLLRPTTAFKDVENDVLKIINGTYDAANLATVMQTVKSEITRMGSK